MREEDKQLSHHCKMESKISTAADELEFWGKIEIGSGEELY